MQIISREEKDSHITCIIQLDDNEERSEHDMYSACTPEYNGKNRSYGNVLGYNERYTVSVKVAHHPYDDIFAAMVTQYGKA